MNAWRVTPPARPASTRVDGFAAAKKARKASAATGINPVKLRRLQRADTEILRVLAIVMSELSSVFCFHRVKLRAWWWRRTRPGR